MQVDIRKLRLLKINHPTHLYQIPTRKIKNTNVPAQRVLLMGMKNPYSEFHISCLGNKIIPQKILFHVQSTTDAVAEFLKLGTHPSNEEGK